ncbi:MAG: hypothetical protein AAGF57_07130 [Pseudomonadota bacterium]
MKAPAALPIAALWLLPMGQLLAQNYPEMHEDRTPPYVTSFEEEGPVGGETKDSDLDLEEEGLDAGYQLDGAATDADAPEPQFAPIPEE